MNRYRVTYYVDGRTFITVIGAYSLDDAWAIVPNRRDVRSIERAQVPAR
jgi:hypothetical protein